METKDLKRTKGITLISLVVLIIVLLILAGVSIMTLTGDNGLLNRTTSAKENTEQAGIIENIRLAYQNALIGQYTNDGKGIETQIKEDLEKIYVGSTIYVEKEEDGTYTVKTPDGTYSIDENGNISKKSEISLKKDGSIVEIITVQIIDGEAKSETITADIKGLEGEINWTITGDENEKFQLSLSEDKKTATITTSNDTEVTSEDVTITVSCGGKTASCSGKITKVVHVSSISSITPTETTVTRGSNTQTITATVNAGATEELVWTSEPSGYVTITKEEINLINNTQTVRLTIAENAPAGKITITAQNHDNNIEENNEVTLTVYVPVSSIGISPNTEVTLKTSGTTNRTADLTATVLPNDATNKEISWTITTTPSSGVASLSETTGSTVTVAAGNTEGTATVTATSLADGTKKVSKTITVERELGYFKQEGTTAYYYPSLTATDAERIAITATNMGDYIGRKVDYTPKTKFTDKGTSSIYRLFYVDVDSGTNNEGKYGDGQGTIYLKADSDGKMLKIAENIATINTIYNGLDKTKSKMAQLNIDWATRNKGKIDSTDYNAMAAAYLCNTEIWKAYIDNAGKARYAIGGVPIEMWVDSYNNFIEKNSSKLVMPSAVTGNKNGKFETTLYSFGYRINLINGYRENNDRTSESNAVVKPTEQTDTDLSERVNVYNQGGYNNTYWLATHSTPNYNFVESVNVYSAYVGGTLWNYDYASYCPMICIESDANIAERK